jgi:hypothetical protein
MAHGADQCWPNTQAQLEKANGLIEPALERANPSEWRSLGFVPGLKGGTVNISPAWFGRGAVSEHFICLGAPCSRLCKNKITPSQSLKKTAVREAMNCIVEVEAVINAIMMATHPAQYAASVKVQASLRRNTLPLSSSKPSINGRP